MKKTDKKNLPIAMILEKELGIIFKNYEYSLDRWGDGDNYCPIGNNSLIFLECENTQKHPNTNVLKYWPFLEKNSSTRVVLFQYFFSENKAPKNRLALCNFLALKIQELFPKRFQYIKLIGGKESITRELKNQNKGVLQVLLNGNSI